MNSQTLLDRAERALGNNDPNLAQAILKELIKWDPGNVSAWLLLSDLVENTDYARQCLERVLGLEPDNVEAQQKLARLEDPFSDLIAFVKGGEDVGNEAVSTEVEGPVVDVRSGETQETTVDRIPYMELTTTLPKGGIDKPQQPAGRSSRSQKRRAEPRRKSGRWLEISLGVLAVACLCIVVMIFIGQNPSLLKTGPEPTPDNPYNVILRNRDTANAEDLDGYMDTIHPKAGGRFLTRRAMQDLFDKYDLNYEVHNLIILEQSQDEARVSFTLITRKIRGPAFSNNRVDGVMILRLDNGIWKIYDQEVTNVIYIDN